MPEEYLTLPLLDRPGFFHFFGTKALSEEQAKGVHDGRSLRLTQVHGDGIVKSDTGTENKLVGDALMTDQLGVLITVFTADCLPVIIIDPNRHAVAIVHAGWRGSLLRIVAKTVSAMARSYGSDPGSLLVGMGPRIGPCCFEVGQEVWGQVEIDPAYSAGVISRKRGDKAWVNLPHLNRIQLLNTGVKPDNIADADLCTVCHPNMFNSYRRDKVKGQNMVSGVLLEQ
ncbi:MAG: peptidoglycan editing factor PgeF [Nitrospirae bacterium]|nr:peptidoglycan editing factor PgeF [Candidatus Troglogloeales bacterium]MBI3598013.1 peptidoglycan editing factor PgeF [Candidatus Troglogloeales bacterium]